MGMRLGAPCPWQEAVARWPRDSGQDGKVTERLLTLGAWLASAPQMSQTPTWLNDVAAGARKTQQAAAGTRKTLCSAPLAPSTDGA